DRSVSQQCSHLPSRQLRHNDNNNRDRSQSPRCSSPETRRRSRERRSFNNQ
ncbi:8946_t:CDS:1, partial [Ambispora leptoticha]